jgi:hypothetical protein
MGWAKLVGQLAKAYGKIIRASVECSGVSEIDSIPA